MAVPVRNLVVIDSHFVTENHERAVSWARLGSHLISQPRPFSPRVAAQ